MYVPPQYQGNPESALAVVRAHPLATLTTNATPVPHATHLPLVIPPDTDLLLSDGPQDLRGHRLIGHLNRANPHWAALAEATDGTPALAIFSGPGSYLSPTVYRRVPAAPTWNFVSVHIRGTLRVLPQGQETLDVVRRTVEELEGRFGLGWDMTDSLDYFRRIVPGVGAFELHVEQVDGMFKLSQEQPEEVRDRAVRHFGPGSKGAHPELSCWMARAAAGHIRTHGGER
ncbi:FMN-binding negative transcriptional regulator [Streptomyces sp. NPDC057052]|uniref:FMN-binding negative transcriptional regulator n=1 Tax=Streptomyces sp. NPDC057052 TaxID=3346010 RepID=UPI00363E1147